MSKTLMETAIARGQGKSTTGAILENLMLEFIMPPSLAMIIDAESDNRNRTLADLRLLVKSHGGTVTPTSYLFQKKGRIVFGADEQGLIWDSILDEVIEVGAEDVEMEDDGTIVVWTEPNRLTSVAEALEKSLGLKVQSSNIIWAPNEDTKMPLEDEERATRLRDFFDVLQDHSEIQGVYANASQGQLEDHIWDELQGRLDA
jgi:transcriptional/translational regulatory protein YebC/TACO1